MVAAIMAMVPDAFIRTPQKCNSRLFIVVSASSQLVWESVRRLRGCQLLKRPQSWGSNVGEQPLAECR